MHEIFRRFDERVEALVGSPWAFLGAIAVLLVWGASGPFYGFSGQWQLVVNSFTTIVTFLIVFLIQNTQSRDFQTLNLKLDELIRVSAGAHPGLINLEELSDDELNHLEQAFHRLRECNPGMNAQVSAEIARLLTQRKPGS